jgi:hypothetical protein
MSWDKLIYPTDVLLFIIVIHLWQDVQKDHSPFHSTRKKLSNEGVGLQ